MTRQRPLTASDFYRFFQCPHWPYWERFGDKKDRRPLTDFEEQRLADGLEHERQVVAKTYPERREIRTTTINDGYKRTLALMKEGVPAIYQGWLTHADWVGRPDVLERRSGKSVFGDWYYIPVDIKRSHELKKEHKAQLTFYALLLEKIQQRLPAKGTVLNGDGERLEFAIEDFLSEFRNIEEKLERIRAGEMPDPVYRKACEDVSPWGKACFRLAHERQDIALLFNVDVRRLQALRELGIRTIDDAANLEPDQLEGRSPGLTHRALTTIQQQARSLRDELVIIRKPFHDPLEGVEIHFDIESHPPTDTDYLYGFWIRDIPEGRYQCFVAEKPEDEKKMWKAFLAWLPTLPSTYTVYHYADHEHTRLLLLAKRYGDQDNPWLERFMSRLFDLKTIRDHAVFPLYFYSLKAIGKFLGCHWDSDVKSGGASISAYDKWRSTKQRSILESIIQYNEEDVRGTAFLLDWLRTYAKKEMTFEKPYPWGKQ